MTIFQHIHCEGPGAIGDWARARGHAIATTRLDLGEPLPDPDDVDFLVVMGGPMNIYQDRDHPWLREEREFIAAHISAGKPTVGICLGAQFLADALGGRVMQNPHVEIGCFPVAFTAEARARFPFLPASLPVTHWHGDTFDLPKGALRLASSEGCLNQGFVFGEHVLALQFHPEVSGTDLAAWMQAFDGELPAGRYVSSAEEILATPAETFAAGHSTLSSLLDALFC